MNMTNSEMRMKRLLTQKQILNQKRRMKKKQMSLQVYLQTEGMVYRR